MKGWVIYDDDDEGWVFHKCFFKQNVFYYLELIFITESGTWWGNNKSHIRIILEMERKKGKLLKIRYIDKYYFMLVVKKMHVYS